jgi:hypothetical protein
MELALMVGLGASGGFGSDPPPPPHAASNNTAAADIAPGTNQVGTRDREEFMSDRWAKAESAATDGDYGSAAR